VTRVLAGLGLILALAASPAEASRLVVLVDSLRLFQLEVRPTYLLPDGTVIDHDRIVRSCAALRTTDWLVYDPASEVCRLESEVQKSLRPPSRPDSTGILIFDSVSRQHCSPGACQVLVGMPPGDPVFADRFEATP
jgi:hypothetical protein